MSSVLEELLSLLALEKVEENIFRGASQDLGWGRVFGGQVLGQALSAASQTVPEDRKAHSLHGYFLRPGDAKLPIVFIVDRIRDGRSFTTRRVLAVQAGETIFNLSASYQMVEEGLDHQSSLPEGIPGPEGLASEQELGRQIADRIPEPLRTMALSERPIEIRPVEPANPFKPSPRPPNRYVWFRTTGPLPDGCPVHQNLLAYASDFHFLATSMQPHGVSWLTPGMQVASIDHAMWFHRPFRMDKWVLYEVESPSASGARGLVRGNLYSESGRLIASTAQEGLIRDRRKGHK